MNGWVNAMTPDRVDLSSASTLSPEKQIAFALLIFERMLPSLIAFSKDTGLDASCYLRAKDLAWGRLQGIADSAANMARLNQLCTKSAPDTEDFTHGQTSFALNAAATMCEVLEFILSGNPDLIDHVSTFAKDSVHLYLSGLEPSLITTKEKINRIAAHPLMQQELDRQQEDVRFLSKLPDPPDDKAISMLKTRAANQAPLLPASFTEGGA
jgi:uncharacterized protein YjaG (DUF416 family)